MPQYSLGKITVPNAGTPVRLTSTKTHCHAILIQHWYSNTGRVHIGDSTISVATGAGHYGILAVPTTNVLQAYNTALTDAPNALNLADYWIDVSVSGEAVIVTYLVL